MDRDEVTVSAAVLIVSFNGADYLESCIASLLQADYGNILCTIWILDNASTDGSQELLRGLVANFRSSAIAKIRLEFSGTNLGFARANNRLWELVNEQSPDTDYLFLLNQDTEVDPLFLKSAIDYLQSHPEAGCAQSLLLLDPQRDQINTAGNAAHFLGFGLPTHYRERLDRVRPAAVDGLSGEIGYPSGAALLISSALVREVGLFQSRMFMYLEDADLGWKLRQVGRPPHVCSASRVYHKYKFNDSFSFYEQLERNRLWLLLTYYKFTTLAVLLPAIAFMEAGQVVFSISRGLFLQKLRSYGFFLRPRNVALIWRLRREASARRQISDREFLASMAGTLDSPHLSSTLLRYVANPVFNCYLRMLQWIVVW